MISLLNFYGVFIGLYGVFWLALPIYNAMFLAGSDQYKYNFLSANFWGLYFMAGVQILLIFLNWNFLVDGFADYYSVYQSTVTLTITIIQSICYLA
jgi:hypothetical protein